MIKKKQSKTCLMTALSHTKTETEMGWLDHKQICRKWFVTFLSTYLSCFPSGLKKKRIRVMKRTDMDKFQKIIKTDEKKKLEK